LDSKWVEKASKASRVDYCGVVVVEEEEKDALR